MDKRAVLETYGNVKWQPYGRYDLRSSGGKKHVYYGSIDDMHEYIAILLRETVMNIENG